MGVMVISIFLQVLARFVFTYFNLSISVPWTEELARYLMFWVVFLGGAVAVHKSRMIAMEAILSVVPGKMTKAISLFAHVVSLIFYGFILVIGFKWAMTSGISRTSTAMKMPMIYVYSAMIVGAMLMILNTLTILVNSFSKKDLSVRNSN